MPLVPTILCGGAGSRLWPVSRETHPKPFIQLSDGQNLLQKTFLRAAQLPDVSEMLIVTNRELFFKSQDACRIVNTRKLNTSFILEPVGRNTAAAIAASCCHIAQRYGSEALVLVLPADHLVTDIPAFIKAVEEARHLAAEHLIVTFGVKPDGPETGYGYIEAQGHSVLRFIEKPSLDNAKIYYESAQFFWNAGIFCATVSTWLREIQEHCPEIIEKIKPCLEKSLVAVGDGFTQVTLDSDTFSHVRDISIDYALIEKSKAIAVVPCNMGWSDIGSWKALSYLSPADASGNTIQANALLEDTTHCHVQGDSRLIAMLGVHNLFVIDTPDALLIADKNRGEDVKSLYVQLKEKNHETYKQHRTVHRPWGTYTILEEGKQFKIKRIEVRSGASLSLQMHHHRSEHWIVVSGMAKITNGETHMFLRTNESTYIPAGHKHRLENPGVLPLVIIEVQSGEYMGEDDILRFEDVYGRA